MGRQVVYTGRRSNTWGASRRGFELSILGKQIQQRSEPHRQDDPRKRKACDRAGCNATGFLRFEPPKQSRRACAFDDDARLQSTSADAPDKPASSMAECDGAKKAGAYCRAGASVA